MFEINQKVLVPGVLDNTYQEGIVVEASKNWAEFVVQLADGERRWYANFEIKPLDENKPDANKFKPESLGLVPVYSGGHLRVSYRYVWQSVRENDYHQRVPVRSTIVEKAVGHDAQGNQQWVLVKDPHPQTSELAQALLDAHSVPYRREDLSQYSDNDELWWEWMNDEDE